MAKFFEDVGKRKGRQPTPFDHKAAAYLAHHLLTAKLTKQPKLTQWAVEFMLMRTKDRVDKDEFKAMLLWYCAHLKEKWMPMAFSAKAFRKKFYQIKRAKELNYVEPVLVISEEAKAFAAAFSYNWPPPTKPEDVLPCIQKSMDSHKRARVNIIAHLAAAESAVAAELAKGKRRTAKGSPTHNHCLLTEALTFLGTTPEFIHSYFCEAIQFQTWAKWPGLGKWAFTIHTARFKRRLLTYIQAEQYDEKDAVWLLEKMNEDR